MNARLAEIERVLAERDRRAVVCAQVVRSPE
jgi:hypothetical protein